MFEEIKKYIIGILIVIFSVCYAFKLIDTELFLKLLGILIGGFAYEVKKGIEDLKVGLGLKKE